MAPIEETFGFSEVVYLHDAYTELPETGRTMGEKVGMILRNLPEEIRIKLPYLVKEELRETLYALDITDRFGSYSVAGKLYVYPNTNNAQKPINRISIYTEISKKLKDVKNGGILGKLLFGIDIKGDGISKGFEELYCTSIKGKDFCNKKIDIDTISHGSLNVWNLYVPMPNKEKMETVCLKQGIQYMEEGAQQWSKIMLRSY